MCICKVHKTVKCKVNVMTSVHSSCGWSNWPLETVEAVEIVWARQCCQGAPSPLSIAQVSLYSTPQAHDLHKLPRCYLELLSPLTLEPDTVCLAPRAFLAVLEKSSCILLLAFFSPLLTSLNKGKQSMGELRKFQILLKKPIQLKSVVYSL